jgi:outer membrane protein
MMKRSTRGAAKVSIVWTIGAVVAFLVAIVMFFLTSQVSTENEHNAAKYLAEKKELETRVTAQVKQLQALSEVVGFYDEKAGGHTEPEAVTAGLATLRESFPDVDPSIKTVQKSVPVVIQAYNTQKSRVKDLETQIAGLRQENETLNKNMRDLSDQNAKELANLRSQVRDAEQAKTDMQGELERQLAEERAKLIQDLLKQASPKIEALAKAEGVNIIVDREAVVWADKAVDLTSKLNAEMK